MQIERARNHGFRDGKCLPRRCGKHFYSKTNGSCTALFAGDCYRARATCIVFVETNEIVSISIENQSSEVVQLNSRHWVILDSLNNEEVVNGEGVIGKKPVIRPGQTHKYKSGCLLASPFGAMYGYYRMINLSNTKKFNVIIPSFKLSAPFAIN